MADLADVQLTAPPRRRHVSIVFCDLADSTRTLSALGDVANNELRHDLFAALRCAIHTSGGREIKNLGDGFMVAFPDVERAVRGAAAMHMAAARTAQRWRRIPVVLRIGCSAGSATEEDGDWFGVPVVEAARLCAAAAPGEILVAAHALPKDDRWRGRRAILDLRGLEAPLPVVRLISPTVPDASWVPPPQFDATWAAPIVGREEQVARLMALLERCFGSNGSTGAGAFAAVVGGPGSGRTRLLAELATSAAAHGAVVTGAGAAPDRTGLDVLAAAVRWVVGGLPPHRAEPLDESALDAVAALVPAGEVWWPSLGGRSGHLDNAVQAAECLVRAVTATAPMVILVDDVHHAAPLFLEALRSLARLTATDRVLLVVTCDRDAWRSEFRGQLPGALTVAVPPLPTSALLGMLRPLADGEDDAARAVAVLQAETTALPGDVNDVIAALPTVGGGTLTTRLRKALVHACPYKGLLAYEPEDADRFVGREVQTGAVLERLDHVGLVAVVGVSGAGKSSLLRAGIVPALIRWAESEGRPPRIPVITPGHDPMSALRAATSEPLAALLVDQFEELFTQCDDAEDRTAFAARLTACATSGIRVVIAVRSDLFGEMAGLPSLAPLAGRGTVLLAAPGTDEMRRIICEPAARAGLELEAGFIDLVLEDIGSDPGSLPLLSHVLLETWRRRRGGLLTAAAYRAAGGARGAIARSADQLYAALPPADRTIARQLLLRLTEVGDDTISRRTVAAHELVQTNGTSLETSRVLETLVHGRLVTLAEDGAATLAHEALLRRWPRLEAWIDEDRESLKMARHLSASAREWVRLGRPESELFRGIRLGTVQEWAAATSPTLTESESEFLGASVAAAEATNRRERRIAIRLRRLLAATSVLTALAVGAGAVAVQQRERAEQRAGDARANAELALTRQLAAEAVATAAEAPARAFNLAVEAYRRMPDLPSTRSALLSVLLAKPSFMGYLGAPAGGLAGPMAANTDGLAVFPTSDGIRVWDTRTGIGRPTIPVISRDLSLRSVALTGDGRVVAFHGGRVRQWDAATGRAAGQLDVPFENGAIDVDDDGRRAVISNGNQVAVVDLAGGRVQAGPLALASRPSGGAKAATAISGDGDVVAVFGDDDGPTIELRGAEALDLLAPPIRLPAGYDPEALDLDRSGDRALLIGGFEPTLILDLSTGTQREIGGGNSWNGLFARRNGEDVAVVIGEYETRLFRPDGTSLLAVPAGGVYTEAALAGDLVVLGGSPPAAWSIDGRSLLWDAPLDAGGGTPTYISADGRYLSTWTTDGVPMSSVLDLHTGERTPPVPGDVSFLADGLRRWSDFPHQQVHITDAHGRDVMPAFPLPDLMTWDAVDPLGRWVAWGAANDGFYGGYVADARSRRILLRIRVRPAADTDGVGGDVNYEFPEFSPDGNRVLFTGHGRLTLTSMPDGQRLLDVREPGYAATFSPDGRSILVTRTGGVVVRDAATGRVTAGPFPDELGVIQWVQMSAHDSFIAVASEARLQLFDVASGQRLGSDLPALPGSFGMFLGDRQLLFGTPEGIVGLPLDPELWADLACRAAASNLSKEEWRLYLGDEPYRAVCPGLRPRA